MTHVEIWLGDGPKTIGARWNNGKVQIWDHYKFEAKSFANTVYYFKSIDTWLKGICKRWVNLQVILFFPSFVCTIWKTYMDQSMHWGENLCFL